MASTDFVPAAATWSGVVMVPLQEDTLSATEQLPLLERDPFNRLRSRPCRSQVEHERFAAALAAPRERATRAESARQ